VLIYFVIEKGFEVLQLIDLTIRYWFTSEPTLSSLANNIDYAAVGRGEITSQFRDVGESRYLELRFTSSANITDWLGGNGNANIFPIGAQTGDIQCGFGSSSSPNFDQTNDYSFDPFLSSF